MSRTVTRFSGGRFGGGRFGANPLVPDLSGINVAGLPNGTAEITNYDGSTTFTLTISGSSETHYNGSKEFTVADFATAPQNFVGPAASGTEATGETLTVDLAGIWLYDDDYDVPVITYQWYKDDVAISGATSTSYVVQPGDAGSTITVRETATQIGGRVGTVTSDDEFDIPAVSYDVDDDFSSYSDGQVLGDHANWTLFKNDGPQEIVVDGTNNWASISHASQGGWDRMFSNTAIATDQNVNVTLAELGTANENEYVELFLCYTDVNNHYYLQARKLNGQQDRLRLVRVLAGSGTTLAEPNWNGELSFGLTKTGTTLDLIVNGSSVQTITGESSLLGGSIGFGLYRPWAFTNNTKIGRIYGGGN